MDAPAGGGLPGAPVQALGSQIEGLVEVLGAGLAANDGPAGTAGDLDVLAAPVLSGISLVLELDIRADDLLVVTLDLGQLLGHMLSVVVRDHHVAPSDDDFHPVHGCAATSVHSASTTVGRRLDRSGSILRVRPDGYASGSGPSDVRRHCRDVPDASAMRRMYVGCGARR